MSDIVERLRNGIEWTGPTQDDTGQTENLMDEAADEITRLRAEVERLTEWNREIAVNAREFVAENERLRAEVQTWQGHAKAAIWSDSEECKLLTAEVEKLRAALKKINVGDGWAALIARAALEASDDQ